MSSNYSRRRRNFLQSSLAGLAMVGIAGNFVNATHAQELTEVANATQAYTIHYPANMERLHSFKIRIKAKTLNDDEGINTSLKADHALSDSIEVFFKGKKIGVFSIEQISTPDINKLIIDHSSANEARPPEQPAAQQDLVEMSAKHS